MTPSASELTFIAYNNDHEPIADDEPPPSGPCSFPGTNRAEASRLADASVVEVAQHVASALESRGHPCELVAVRNSARPLVERLASTKRGVVFNLVESLGSDAAREAELPALLARLDVRYTGNGAEALRTALDKGRVRRVLASQGIRVARGAVVRDSVAAVALVARRRLRFPLFVKPARLDASIAVSQASFVRNVDELRLQVQALVTACVGGVVVEEYLPGPEINVAFWPSDRRPVFAASCIDFSSFREGLLPIVTYDCKWVETSEEYSARSVPAHTILDEVTIAAAVRLARRALAAVAIRAYARVDLRLDATGAPCVMDVNPNPDLHPDAGYALSLASAGHDYAAVIEGILARARELHHADHSPVVPHRPRAPRRAALSNAGVQRR